MHFGFITVCCTDVALRWECRLPRQAHRIILYRQQGVYAQPHWESFYNSIDTRTSAFTLLDRMTDRNWKKKQNTLGGRRGREKSCEELGQQADAAHKRTIINLSIGYAYADPARRRKRRVCKQKRGKGTMRGEAKAKNCGVPRAHRHTHRLAMERLH